jgi:cytochrome b
MVVVMLLLVAFQVGTGLFATDDITWSGPYSCAVGSPVAKLLTRLHHFNFKLIWAAMTAHVAAILYYALVKKQNLTSTMVRGWRPAEAVPAREGISSSQLWKAAIVMLVSIGVVYCVLQAAPQQGDAY